MNKLALTTFVLATSLTSAAFAKGGFTGPINPQPTPDQLAPPTIKPVKVKGLSDALWETEAGKRFLGTLHSDEPVIDTLDPGARCTDIHAGTDLQIPLYHDSVLGFPFTLGVGGGVGIDATATEMSAKASFGPTLTVLGAPTKPLDLRFSASTNNMGQNTMDLKLYAFTVQLESYNLAASTTPIDFLVWPSYMVPTTISNPLGGSYDCTWTGLHPCSASWGAEPLAATIFGGIAFRLNSSGVQAHALVVARADSSVHVGGNASLTFYNPLTGKDQTITASATGTGAVNFMHGTFIGNAELVPYNSHWLAYAESSVDVEDVLGAKVSARFEFPADVHAPVTVTPFARAPYAFGDLRSYSCTFDKAWK